MSDEKAVNIHYNKGPNERVEAIWCVDLETSEELLIDLLANKIIARKDKDGNIV
jgi:hypothetical protein